MTMGSISMSSKQIDLSSSCKEVCTFDTKLAQLTTTQKVICAKTQSRMSVLQAHLYASASF